jgi:hypothetical protein
MLTMLLALAIQGDPLPGFDANRWMLVDPAAHVMNYLGRQSLYLERGIALLKDSAFADGTIEFDLALHGHPSFAGVLFRGQSPHDYELIYVRPQRSRQPDALQYTPIISDQEAWQLYYGDGYTAAAELPVNRWLHLRLVLAGYTARLYVDNAIEPQLVITDLKRPWMAGQIGLWGGAGAANFSNITLTPARSDPPARRPTVGPPLGTIPHWRLSAAADAAKTSPLTLPNGEPSPATWESVPVESSGLLNIAQYRRKVTVGRDVVFARTVLRSSRAQRVRLTFGYSDEISIFLNGTLLFTGSSGYLARDASYLGTLTLGLDAVYLPLLPGANELIISVVEAFGGWGLAARIEPAAAAVIE